LILVGISKEGQAIVEPGVTHHHSLARDELFTRIYPQVDVLILPSKAEGFGLVLLEAMSFGIPLIGRNAWAMPEIVEDGVNGFLVANDKVESLVKCITKIVDSPDLFESLRRGAKQSFQEKFAIPIHNTRLKEIYNEIIDNNGKQD
jgi:glycosyltransferase involved in cell wall biosynthesis